MRQAARTFVAVTVVAFALLAASTASAGINRWTSHGPSDVPTAIAVDPSSTWTVYAATWGRLFKSADGGNRWDALPPPGGEIGYGGIVAAAATRPTTVYYAVVANELNIETMGFYRSPDAGRTWSGPILEGLNARTETLAVAPSDPLTVYAGSYAHGGPYRSTDGGVTWTSAGQFWQVLSMAVDPRDTKTVYAGAAPDGDPDGVWKTTDGGETWSLLLEDHNVVAQDRANPDVLYAGGYGVYRSMDAGATWTYLPATAGWAVRAIAVDPQRPSHIVVSAYGNGIFESENGGATWAALNTGLPHLDVDQLVFDRLGRTLHVILTRGYPDEHRAAGVFSYTALHATPGPDRLVGTPGNDTIQALAGHDRVHALAGDDRIGGGRGNDVLHAGRGNDRVFGGPGSDVILVRDGERDVVFCGSGFDRVNTNELDVVAEDCERVRQGIPLLPPPVLLVSRAGAQRAVQESFCVSITNDDGSAVGGCGDTPNLEPRRLSIVRPGERVTIRFRGATFAKGGVWVYPRGCENRARWRFGITSPTTHWRVPRNSQPEMRFELGLFAEFETRDGRAGDTSNTLGLLVSRTRVRDVIPAGTSLACGRS